jgi:hypothetical protein
MKNWSAAEWCLFVLTLTIPLCLMGTTWVRMVTKNPIPTETALAITDMLKIIIGGGIRCMRHFTFTK